jgi:hypothetical protein
MFSIFKAAKDFASNVCEEVKSELGPCGINYNINYGRQKNNGGHDPRTNKGNDRNPTQRAADAKKRCRNK